MIDVTNIKTTSSWGGLPGTFDVEVCYDWLDSYLIITRSGGAKSIPGQTENLIIQSLYNAAISTQHTFEIETRPADDESGYIEYETSNDFAIFGFTNFYVQWSTGNDSWPGTKDKPWKTIQHAANVLNPGEVAIVLPGTQYESVHITNSGEPWGRVITFKAQGNVKVTPISNGKIFFKHFLLFWSFPKIF